MRCRKTPPMAGLGLYPRTARQPFATGLHGVAEELLRRAEAKNALDAQLQKTLRAAQRLKEAGCCGSSLAQTVEDVEDGTPRSEPIQLCRERGSDLYLCYYGMTHTHTCLRCECQGLVACTYLVRRVCPVSHDQEVSKFE
ncbi:unnamed protein product [Durusdinium trenchii]|uniref:Uncharacterized protein n=1 Tax=Durusdinium trenchii TaxID=1381693 RepID=A0ABP0QUS1_9DINO